MTDNSNDNNFIEKGIYKIRESLDKGNPVMVSVAAGFGNNGSPHLILITGYEEDNFVYHDPNNSDGEMKKAHLVNKARFIEFWRFFGIFLD